VSEPEITVRAAVEADAFGIARVHVETWRDAYAGILPNDYLADGLRLPDRTAMWARLLRGQGERDLILVAEAPGEIVGFASAGPPRGTANGFDAELYTLYVLTDFQGFGVGRALLRGVALALGARGAKSLVTEVLRANPSRFFYEAMGGRRLAEITDRFAGQNLPAVIYGWPELAALTAKV